MEIQDVPPQRVLAGRKNPYCSLLDMLKDKLCSLGFEQFDGPLVETEFWNADALFMPQIHPRCLENWGIQMPCAVAEICLDAVR
jgi:phenylalanyl-tRNA synthetase alpha subunit